MSQLNSVSRPACRDSFLQHLDQIKRRNWEDKIFYLPSDIKTWMNEVSTGQTHSNIVQLVSSLYAERFAKIRADHCTKQQLVLAVLLHPEVDCGHLIDVFARCGLTDYHLSMPDASSFYQLIVDDLRTEQPATPETLMGEFERYDYEAVTRAFDHVRWAFCPALEFHMETTLPFGPCILPFLHGSVVNKKGGTANVRHYKIEEDLVESQELKLALSSSRHKDPDHGWCYEFAIKSYFPGWEDTYKLESEAFRGVRDQEGVVRYLGEYHFKGSGDTSPTHNIILEFGERDLDEYLADTYPPVLTVEIIAFWEELFKVANTLKMLHHLEHKGEDGKKSYYKGWHGDIKPDNILRIRGQFKLADFGFTKFEKDEIGNTRTLLLGGTETYGAPECDKRRSGTSTPHLQTIDTWSFGCVLSAVATWVVLGSQAYDNYRKVRKMEISDIRKRIRDGKGGSAPSGDDAFHNGIQVLSSVMNWHDYLRNSTRKADTITHRVLNLIQDKMLHENPDERPTFEKLCGELEDIVVLAKNDQQRLEDKKDLIKLEPDTLAALLRLDQEAPKVAVAISQANSGAGENAMRSYGALHPIGPNDTRLRSERVKKSERLDKIVVGKTANRAGAIKTDLRHLGLGILSESQHLSESPQQISADANEEPLGGHEWGISGRNIPHIKIFDSPGASGNGTFFPASEGSTKIAPNPHRSTLIPMHRAQNNVNNAVFSTAKDQVPSTQTPSLFKGKGKEAAFEIKRTGSKHASHNSVHQDHDHIPVTPPEQSSITKWELSSEEIPPFPEPYELPSSTFPPRRRPLTPQMSPEYIPRASDSNDQTGSLSPSSIQASSLAIFREHARLVKMWEDKKGPFTSLISKIPHDPWLKKFISNRDIVFIMDNAATMKPHWAVATTVLETLAMKIGPLDTDGLDLMYTIGDDHNLEEIKGWNIPKRFKASMQDSEQEITDRHKTNLKETLERIFDGYTDISKRMTLIVLTDGLWEGCAKRDDVQKCIASFLGELKEKLKKRESRWFSIQFISFGDDKQALERLRHLDDNMHSKQNEEDVIDTKPWWYHDVSKLILGSITDDGDRDDPPSPSLMPSSSGISRIQTSNTLTTPPILERRNSWRRLKNKVTKS